jgi:hypothetical protein
MSNEAVENTMDSETSWVRARQFANLLNPIPFSVSNAIQTLWANHVENVALGSKSVWDQSLIVVRQIDKSVKLKTPIYFAALALQPDDFETNTEDDASKALVQILGPGLFASLLGLVYLHRRCNKILTTENWTKLSEEYVLNMEIGYMTGLTMPQLGGPAGMLISGIRFAALATLLLWTPEHYLKYRRSKRRVLDLEYERSLWGCDHAQIVACLIRALGYRTDAQEVTRAFRGDLRTALPGDLDAWRIGVEYIESIKQTAQLPQSSGETPLGSSHSTLADLVDDITEIMKEGSSFSWMKRVSAGDDKSSTEEGQGG